MPERITQRGSVAYAAAGGSSAGKDAMPVKVGPPGLSAGGW
jgi:hypothetical protein